MKYNWTRFRNGSSQKLQYFRHSFPTQACFEKANYLKNKHGSTWKGNISGFIVPENDPSPRWCITTTSRIIITWQKRGGINGPERQRTEKKARPAFGKIILGKRNFSKVFAFSADTVAGIGGPFHPLEPEEGWREGIQTARAKRERGSGGSAQLPELNVTQLSDLQCEPPQCMIFAIVRVLACTRLARTRMHSCSPKWRVPPLQRSPTRANSFHSLSLPFLCPRSSRSVPTLLIHSSTRNLSSFARILSMFIDILLSVQRWILQART